MFYPIMGSSGSGKTHYILQKAGELALRGEKVIVIVPEQFSFETERSAYRLFGAEAALNIEVLSFTRLCSKVFYTYGGVAGEYISEVAKQTVISLAVGELADKLEIYSSAVKNPTFAVTILGAIEEFKNAGILPEQVAQTALEIKSSSLSSKLAELSEIYAVYKAMIDLGYLDSKDDLSRCVKMLEGHNFFSEYTVLIDSFMTYMAGEYALINHIVGEAKDTYITFICNSLTEQSGEMGVFSVAVKTAGRIIKMAKASAVEVHTPIKLTECPRFENAELAFLQQEYPQQIPEHYPDKVSAIKLVEAKDPYDEIAYVAATICKLVREDGMRYKDIAVIARNLARFGTAVEDIFERYGIPVFADKRDDLLAVPLVRGILAALDAIDKGFETQSLIAFAKSTLMGLSALEVASLENYCYIWNTKGAAWKNEFTANPNGLSDRFSDKDRKQLDEINVTRDKLIKPLITLRETVKSCT
ncbi:MAG: 3'-5' exonuclease, partial [Oscillospiraceae bacterium]